MEKKLKLFRNFCVFYLNLFLAITDSNAGKMKEKPLFSMDPSSFLKLKALKVIPTDTNSPNIMRLYFPRNKNAERAIKISDVKSDNKNASEPSTVSSVNQFSEKELKKDFIEVDDILVVQDPKNIDELLKDQKINEVTSASPESSTVQTTESTQSTENKLDKKDLETLFNQSLRYKKLADKLGKPESFNKSSNDRGLFKREGKLNDQIKDIPDTTDKDIKSDDVSRNRDFDIVSSSSVATPVAPATQIVENSTEKVDQIQTTTEVNVKKDVTEGAGKSIDVVEEQTTEASSNTENAKTDSANGETVGASLKDIQADEKNLEIDQQIITEETKMVEHDEKKVNDDMAKRESDQDTLETDKEKFSEDREKFLDDLKLSNVEQTTPVSIIVDVDDDLVPTTPVSLKQLQIDEKTLEIDQSKIANDTKQVQDDVEKLNIDQGLRNMDKALLDMNKSQFSADKDKFLVDLESTDTSTPFKMETQMTTTEQPTKIQTVSETEAPKTVDVKYFLIKNL